MRWQLHVAPPAWCAAVGVNRLFVAVKPQVHHPMNGDTSVAAMTDAATATSSTATTYPTCLMLNVMRLLGKRDLARVAATCTAFSDLTEAKKARVRRNWATARAFVHMRSAALFWYAHTGKQLCGPCGKWAQHDRAAFDYEFNQD